MKKSPAECDILAGANLTHTWGGGGSEQKSRHVYAMKQFLGADADIKQCKHGVLFRFLDKHYLPDNS